MSNKELIQGCQKGQKESQYQLVQQYSAMLMTVCRRYVADKATAKDVLQESFIKIFRHINKYNDTGSFEAWMRKIAVRCSLDWLNKKHLKFEMVQMESLPMGNIEPIVYGQLEMEEIVLLIQELTPSLRSVFNLNVLEGYNHKEIGELLNISESTSRANLVRARKILQVKLNEREFKKSKSA